MICHENENTYHAGRCRHSWAWYGSWHGLPGIVCDSKMRFGSKGVKAERIYAKWAAKAVKASQTDYFFFRASITIFMSFFYLSSSCDVYCICGWRFSFIFVVTSRNKCLPREKFAGKSVYHWEKGDEQIIQYAQ